MKPQRIFRLLPDMRDTEAVAVILGIYDAFGDRLYGEAVSEREHAVQCAHAARLERAADSLVVAALLHDIGHLLHAAGEDVADQGIDMRHEALGERFLARRMPLRVTRPIGLHVAAKRYLASAETGYVDSLSPASAKSLALQGGPMTPSEMATFQREPYAEDAIRLRRWDEMGKQIDWKTPPMEAYADLIAAECAFETMVGASGVDQI